MKKPMTIAAVLAGAMAAWGVPAKPAAETPATGPATVSAKVKQVAGTDTRTGECFYKDGRVRMAWDFGKRTMIFLHNGKKCLQFEATEKKVRERKQSVDELLPWLSVYKEEFGEKKALGEELVDGKPCLVTQFTNERSQTVKEWAWKAHPTLILKQEISFEGTVENGTYLSGVSVGQELDETLFTLPEDVVHYLVGGPAPDFALKPHNSDQPVKLSSYKGKKPVLLNFFATWCVPCKHETPDFIKVYQDYKDRVEFLSIDVFEKPTDGEPKKLVEGFVKDFGVPWPILMDEKGPRGKPDVSEGRYDAMALPVNVGVDAQGIIRFHRRGATTEAQLRQELDKLFPSKAP